MGSVTFSDWKVSICSFYPFLKSLQFHQIPVSPVVVVKFMFEFSLFFFPILVDVSLFQQPLLGSVDLLLNPEGTSYVYLCLERVNINLEIFNIISTYQIPIVWI